MEDLGKKEVEFSKVIIPEVSQQDLKLIKEICPKNIRTNKIKVKYMKIKN